MAHDDTAPELVEDGERLNRRPGLTRFHGESASSRDQGLPRTFEVAEQTYGIIEWSEFNADRWSTLDAG
jgi:hypothetical protein